MMSYLLYTSGHRNSMTIEWRLGCNQIFVMLLGIGIMPDMRDVSAIITHFKYLWAQEFNHKIRTSLLYAYFLYTSGHRISTKNEGHLSYSRTFYMLLGMGIL